MTTSVNNAISTITEAAAKIKELESRILECKSYEDYLPIKKELVRQYETMQLYSAMLQDACKATISVERVAE